jgi:hypothetical protein
MKDRVKKAAFAFWYFVLIAISVDALLEFGYPRSNYSPGPMGPITELLAMVLILGTGIPMLLYLWKRTPHHTGSIILIAIFMTSTVLLAGLLAPNVAASAERRAKVQWYVNDLQSQGLIVVDAGQYYYRHGGGATQLTSYAEVAATAKSINCSTIYFRSGTPWNFIFFMGDGLQMVFYKPQVPGPFLPGEYLYYAPYDPNTGISLPT